MTIIQINWRLVYNPELKERTKNLRKNMTEPEKKLWFWFLRWIQNTFLLPPRLRGTEGEFSIKAELKNPRGTEAEFSIKAEPKTFRIYKQRPIDNFIVDFYIPKIKLVIEIDWESHFDEQWKAYDIERTQILEWLWLKVIRFTNKEIMNNFDLICHSLEEEFKKLIKFNLYELSD